MLLCRVAENMFWLNRYVERALSTIRVVDVTAHRISDLPRQP